MNLEVGQWIRGLIKTGQIHNFYNSRRWINKRNQILKDQNYECQRCKKKGLYQKAVTVHHIKYVKRYPELALEDDNLEALCRECHEEEHGRKRKHFINEERW